MSKSMLILTINLFLVFLANESVKNSQKESCPPPPACQAFLLALEHAKFHNFGSNATN